MTTAINIFLRTTIRENGIPFSLKLEAPNDTTIAAIEEGRRIASDPSVKELLSISMVKKKALFLMENRVNKVNRVKQEKMEPQLLLRA